ncbi:ankyrin repeat domain-containing protein 29-like isoform X3 [Daphnia pulicaria]|nr:ankyrin repeat domain-containing protein 29-like isoform X3 [Daphnia pulicaria]
MAMRHLLDSGKVHIDSHDKEGTTPLMMAAAAGHVECCRELISQGADPTLRRKTSGASPLFLAAQGGFNDIVSLLLRAGAPVDAQCKDGGTALMVASQQGYADVCLELISTGADVHLQMKDGATSLFLAAQNGHAKIVALLLSSAADKDSSALLVEEMINRRRLDGATALWMAAQMGFDYVVRLLLRAGANPNIIRNDGVSPLLKASQKGHVDAVRELLQSNPSLGLSQNGDSPLYAAVLRRDVPIVRILLRAGADAHLPTTTRSLLSPKALAEKLRFWEITQLFDTTESGEDSSSSSPTM